MDHSGSQTLTTERLLLRPFRLDDAPAMYRNWASDPDVTRFLTWPPHSSENVTRDLLREWTAGYRQPDFYQWAVVLPDEGPEPVGSLTVVKLDESVGAAHMGYCLGKRWWHRGIMAEALHAVIDYLFGVVGVNRIEACHDPNNPDSGRVMAKCGLQHEGTLRRAGRNTQGICDVCVWGLLRTEWQRPG